MKKISLVKDKTRILVANGNQYVSGFGRDVLAEIDKGEPLAMTQKEFMSHCAASGGNWTSMLLSGLKELRPAVFQAIPETLEGESLWVFALVMDTIHLCGVRP